MNEKSRNEENSVTKTFHNYDADRRRRSSRPAVSATSIQEFEQNPPERESEGFCLGDMGLSSDLSDDEVYIPENHKHQVTPGADTQVGSKDRISVQEEASGPVRLMIHALYKLIHLALAPDTNKCRSSIKLRLPVFAALHMI